MFVSYNSYLKKEENQITVKSLLRAICFSSALLLSDEALAFLQSQLFQEFKKTPLYIQIDNHMFMYLCSGVWKGFKVLGSWQLLYIYMNDDVNFQYKLKKTKAKKHPPWPL